MSSELSMIVSCSWLFPAFILILVSYVVIVRFFVCSSVCRPEVRSDFFRFIISSREITIPCLLALRNHFR